jgi:hypothetical protein
VRRQQCLWLGSTKANQNPLYVYPRRRRRSAAISNLNTCVATLCTRFPTLVLGSVAVQGLQ